MREIGFKPYVAPALSSGALSLLLTLRGEWHCGSVFLDGVYMGVKNRYTPAGVETELLPRIPDRRTPLCPCPGGGGASEDDSLTVTCRGGLWPPAGTHCAPLHALRLKRRAGVVAPYQPFVGADIVRPQLQDV